MSYDPNPEVGLQAKIVIERGALSLEDAIHKMSGFPAERFGLKDRGCLAENAAADIVVFDPETIQDHATFENPHQYSTGVEHVLVNGVSIIAAGSEVKDLAAPLPGRYVLFKE
mgnify:CR=1 FL=1